MKKLKQKKNKKRIVRRKRYFWECFTLTEIMVAIAIVGILASVALVSIGAYRAKGQSEKVKASLNTVVASMTSCWAMGGQTEGLTRLDLSCGSELRSLGSSYGSWPDLSNIDDYSYLDEQSADYSAGDPCQVGKLPSHTPVAKKAGGSLFRQLIPTANAGLLTCPTAYPLFCQNTWYFSASSAREQKKVCCNQKMKGCKIIDLSTTCDNTIN